MFPIAAETARNFGSGAPNCLRDNAVLQKMKIEGCSKPRKEFELILVRS
jgi:hypothetical protein